MKKRFNKEEQLFEEFLSHNKGDIDQELALILNDDFLCDVDGEEESEIYFSSNFNELVDSGEFMNEAYEGCY